MPLRITQITIVLTLVVVIMVPHSLHAANSVDIEITSRDRHDTIYVADYEGNPEPATFDFFIENDVPLGGFSLGFKIWTPDNAIWEYRDISDSFDLPDTAYKYLSVVPGSRLDPPEDVFDMTGLLVTERSMDGQDHDTILFGGVSLMDSLPPGPREHMISIHFNPRQPTYIEQICVDTAFVPPAGEFVFSDA